MERDADEAALHHVAAFDVEFDRAEREVGPFDPRDAIPFLLGQMHRARTLRLRRHLAIHGSQFAGLQLRGQIDRLRGGGLRRRRRHAEYENVPNNTAVIPNVN